MALGRNINRTPEQRDFQDWYKATNKDAQERFGDGQYVLMPGATHTFGMPICGTYTRIMARDREPRRIQVSVYDGYEIKNGLKPLGFRFNVKGDNDWSLFVNSLDEAEAIIQKIVSICS